MSIIICLAIILTIASAIAELTKEKIDKTIPIAVMGIILIIYVFGLFNVLNIGVLSVGIVAGISMGYLIYSVIWNFKKKNIKEFFRRIFTPGIIIYILFWIIFLFINKRRLLSSWDEFSHWGLIVKNMFVFNTYGTNPETMVLFRGYPPFTAVFEYFFLAIKNSICEGEIIIAMNVLYVSMVLPLLSNIEWNKNLKKSILVVPLLFVMPLLLFKDFYTTIYVDAILGIFMTYLLYIYFCEENKYIKYISMCLGLISLPLIKAAGSGLAIFAIIIVLLDIILQENKEKNSKKTKEKIIFIITLILCFLIGKHSWSIHLKLTNMSEAWNTSKVTLENIVVLLTGNGENYYYDVIKNFITKFFKEPVELSFGSITNFQLLIVYWIYTIFIGYLLKKREEKNFRRFKNATVILSILYIIYLISLLILYIFTFSEYEATNLASYSRYSFIFANGMFAFNTCFMIKWFEKEKTSKNTIIIIILIICLMAPIKTIENLIINNETEVQVTIASRKQYADICKYASKINVGSKIFYISCGSKGIDVHISRFLLITKQYKRIVSTPFGWWSLGTPRFSGDIWSVDVTKECFSQYLEEKQIDYVYIFKADEIFKEKYGSLFEKLDDIKDKTMYKIENNGNNLILKEVL